MLGGPPQLKPGHGRRVCSAARSRWILGLCLSGRGRRKGPRLARADVPMCSPRTAPCLRRGTVPPSGRGLRGNACSSGPALLRFQGKRPEHAPQLREGTRSTPQCTTRRRRGAGACGESPRQPRAATPSTGRRPHGRSRPGGALRRSGGAVDGPRDPQSRGRLVLQATGGFMLHPIRKASSRTPLLSSRATAASIKRRARQP